MMSREIAASGSCESAVVENQKTPWNIRCALGEAVRLCSIVSMIACVAKHDVCRNKEARCGRDEEVASFNKCDGQGWCLP